MRNVVLGLAVLVGIALAPFSVCAQPSSSEMTDCFTKMMAFETDLIALFKYSQGVDETCAEWLLDVASEYSIKITYLETLLIVVSLINNDDDRNRVKPFVDARMKQTAKEIDLSLEKVNLYISYARSNAIVSTGNQMKTELRRLQELLRK